MMDIQEIREGIAGWFWEKDKKRNNLYLDGIGVIHYSDADQILSYLADKGACFPVEGELSVWEKNTWFWRNCCQQRKKPAKICLECPFIDYKTGKLKAGYKKVITLKEMMGADK